MRFLQILICILMLQACSETSTTTVGNTETKTFKVVTNVDTSKIKDTRDPKVKEAEKKCMAEGRTFKVTMQLPSTPEEKPSTPEFECVD